VGLCPIWKYTTKNSGATRVETPMKTWSRYVPNATLEYTADTGEKRTVAANFRFTRLSAGSVLLSHWQPSTFAFVHFVDVTSDNI
jgi:hypothetical protein